MTAPGREPARVDWCDAARHVLALARARTLAVPSVVPVGAHPVVVGITGPVGSGKSTLAARLCACILSTDDYLPDYENIPEHERDDPRHMDAPLLLSNLADLRAGRPARVPVWSFQTHRRAGLREVAAPARHADPHSGRGHAAPTLIVVEGIHALHASVSPALDVRVFVEAPSAIRWQRWEALEQSGARGWGVEKARAFFHNVAEPTFAQRAAAYRAVADVIVANDGNP